MTSYKHSTKFHGILLKRWGIEMFFWAGATSTSYLCVLRASLEMRHPSPNAQLDLGTFSDTLLSPKAYVQDSY